VEQLARAAAVARASGAATVTIGFNLAAGRLVLPAVLRWFAAEHPDVRTRLWERRSGPQAAALLAGDLDVGFGYGRASDPRLASRHLLTVPIVAVVGAQHPWAGRAAVPMRELAGQGCLLFHRAQSPALHDAIVGAAARADVDLDVRERVDDPIGTGVLVGARPVVAFASAARAAQPPPGLVAVPLTGPAPQVAVHATWRASEQDAVVLALVDAVAAAGPFAGGPPAQMA
jgi:DNA-binding transcriptional LysR family regulator